MTSRLDPHERQAEIGDRVPDEVIDPRIGHRHEDRAAVDHDRQPAKREPFGQALLWVLVVGFVAVALWRLEQAIEGGKFPGEYLAVHQLSGPHEMIVQLLADMPGGLTGLRP